jgi:hypothetical protein
MVAGKRGVITGANVIETTLGGRWGWARRWAGPLAWSALALIVVLMVGGAYLWEVTGTSAEGSSLENLLTGLAFLSFPAMGALIASRRPANAIGWLLLGIGLIAALLVASMGYAAYGLVTNEEGAPGATIAAWFVAWLWFPLIAIIPTFLPLLFPTGSPPSPRWRPVAWFSGAAVAIVSLPAMVEGRLAEGGYDVPNPIGIASLGDTEEQLFTFMGPVLLVLVGLSLASLIFRYRRGSLQERQQLKWIALAIAVFLVMTILEDGFQLRVPVLIFPLTLMAIPVSMAIAVLRYRLYDIDRIISRTVAYGVLIAILGGGYLVVVLALQSLLPVQDDSPLIVAVSTLAVVAAFGPLRTRVKEAVDRRFNRTSYDAQQTVDSFARRLRDEVELELLTTDLVAVVHAAMHPRHVSIWLKPAEPDGG